jgi:hypothetical protein
MAAFKTLAFTFLVAADLVASHAAITNAVGDAGGSGMALGIDSTTPRDGTSRRPFQQDATRFRGDAADTVGETLAGGDNNLEQGTADIMEETGDILPQITPGGSIEMTVHQVNSDGAGPYTCMINADGTATTWDNIQVTTNLEGNERGRNRDGEMGDFPLIAAIPADQTCTGTVAGEENVCLVRCQNPARAGPFGGVIPVQMAQVNNDNTGNVNNGNVNNGNVNNGNANNGNVNNGNANNGNVDNVNNGNVNNGNVNTGNDVVDNGNAVNNGNANTGNTNTGNVNTGNANTGNDVVDNGNAVNNGNANTGNVNTGNVNTGNANTGNANTGNDVVDNGSASSNGNSAQDNSETIADNRNIRSIQSLRNRAIHFRA